METGHYHFGDAVKSTLPIEEWLARENLKHINPGLDRIESMRYARCDLRITKPRTNAGISPLRSGEMDHTAATKDSPLFRLDNKIRKTIFAYAMTYADPIPVRQHCTLNAWYDEKGERLVREVWRFTPALLRACRRIHEEASAIFYANNTFKGTIRNSDTTEISGWVQEVDDAHLREVKEFIISIEPTCFADLLDMSTGPQLCQQARTLAKALSKTSISGPQIDLPTLKHLKNDASLFDFDIDNAEQMRSRWVLELGSAFKKMDEDGSLIKKMKAVMIKARRAGDKKESKSLSDA